MPRIRLPAHNIHAPQASRTGGRRTLRDSTGPARDARAGRELGRPGRSLPPGWWIGAGAILGLGFWAVVARIIWSVL